MNGNYRKLQDAIEACNRKIDPKWSMSGAEGGSRRSSVGKFKRREPQSCV